MCGIAGIVGYAEHCLQAMLAKIHHRGPDFTGSTALAAMHCFLGHVRLSILDLDPRSHQPFVSDCQRYVLVFNGEIYNFSELRAELEQDGHTFRTTSDTEVLLKWLIREGVAGLTRLEGMFAFCFADTQANTLLLVRDPIGEKPLYYSFTVTSGTRRFAFASEIKSLLTLQDLDTSLDREGLFDYLRFLYTAPPHTLYQGIEELPPGHYLTVDLSDRKRQPAQRYYDLESSLDIAPGMTFTDAARRFHSLFSRSVRLRLMSDVPVGVFLSAGIDSNAILAVAQLASTGSPLATFTLEYPRAQDESRAAKRIAENLGLVNTAIPFTQLEFFPALDRVIHLFDQPFGNSTSIVSDMIAAKAAESCKVCLVGDGGDELLVGYPRYHALKHFSALASWPPMFHAGLRRLLNVFPETGRIAVPARRAKQFTKSLGKPMAEAFLDWSSYLDTPTLSWATGTREVQTGFYQDLIATFRRHQADPIRAAVIVDMKSFVPFNLLQNADRTSMAHSLELRTPFLATPLIHGILGLPTAAKVQSRKKALVTVPFERDLPAEILNAPKRPFNPPINVMLKANLPDLKDFILGPTARIGTLLDRSFLATEVNDFSRGTRDNSTLLWGLATLERWLQRAA